MRRISVRRSAVHGRGVFALAPIQAGDLISEYGGAVVPWPEAVEAYQTGDAEDGHTFFFDLGDGHVIDGNRGGNSARWINHGCDPNCEAVVEDRTVVISALREIGPGDELLLDYSLQLSGRISKAERAMYTCRCGAATCRGTMLAQPPDRTSSASTIV
jgi:SET domain-containing protein